MVEIAEMFDVDLLSGMSFVIYPLQRQRSSRWLPTGSAFFPAASNPLAGLVRLIPIERMNALLVISPNPEVIQEAKRMLERLDNGNDCGWRGQAVRLQRAVHPGREASSHPCSRR